FQALEKETGFQLRLMNTMGYDVTCLGNHEFDFGPEWLASMISTANVKGKIPSILIGNTIFDKKDNRDDGLEKLLSDNVVCRKLTMVKDGIKFGLFSIIGKNAVDDSPRALPVTFEKQTSFAKKMVKELRDEKCDIIICVSHSGVEKDKNGAWGGEDVELAKKVMGIDLIIGGHTHTKLDQPIIVNGIPIVQAGEYGEFVGRISLTYSNKHLKVGDYKLIPVDDKISGDKNINQLVQEQKERITAEILKPLGLNYDNPVAESRFILEGNESGNFMASNLGPLVADAIQYYVNKHGGKGTDVSMVAAGVLRDKILVGKLTAPDIFRVMSLGSGNDNVPGYGLSRMYVTGKELKSILEILQVAYKSSPDYYCYYSGIRVEYNPDKGLLKKIKKIEIVHSDGSLINVDFSKKNKSLYSVTANSYMVEFMGIIKKMSFGLIRVIPKDAAGNKIEDMKTAVIDMDENRLGVQEGKEWLALLEYLASMEDDDGNKIPDIDQKYNVPIKTFIQVKASK
ncbi:MAG TPA: 5'-nucleotidase C-terminal domain-containing protein, partial [Bacteroidales bacterium]|nr:5'-nucleotidase C-terminal domain-containing protein [Bacteroidales bacterium]